MYKGLAEVVTYRESVVYCKNLRTTYFHLRRSSNLYDYSNAVTIIITKISKLKFVCTLHKHVEVFINRKNLYVKTKSNMTV